ncbi:dioxygenase [Dactylonectria macrodidyma]|uniref:Dioxygenase n=1 Tax=Dactylonectria macrodidyma TaxID=307937 RepID=A0A9P9FU67_9HYPO|nr:dioxygenase [Dactylonectria macrodidyma]
MDVDANAPAPPLLDLTVDNITPNTVRINSQSGDSCLTYLMNCLTTHLHDFARETRLSTEEWMAALHFLTQCGQMCTDVRQEFILLSDILGLSLLKSVLGPFHTHDAPSLSNGSSMTSDPDGEPLLVVCSIRDAQGNPIPGVKVDIWETDSSGHYDVQHEVRDGPSERCVMTSDAQGEFWFRAVKPVPYPIPDDGPVGKLMALLKRHCWRPSHMHFMFEKEGWDHLITALYLRGDPYETSDAVFGVKRSLVVDLAKVDRSTAQKYGVEEGGWFLQRDFVLASTQETDDLRDRNAMEALANLGLNMKLADHLPVPDLD